MSSSSWRHLIIIALVAALPCLPRPDDSPNQCLLGSPPPEMAQTSDQPTIVDGVEFSVITDKEWLIPAAGQQSRFDIILKIRNNGEKPRQFLLGSGLDFSTNWDFLLKDSAGKSLKGGWTARGAAAATPDRTPRLGKGDSFSWLLWAALRSQKGQIDFLCADPLTNGWAFNGIAAGKHELVVSYHNTHETKIDDAKLWTGKAEVGTAISIKGRN